MRKWIATILAYLLVLQPFLVLGATPVFEMECTSTGCTDTVSSDAFDAAVPGTRIRTNASGLLESVAANTLRTTYADSRWRAMSEGMGANYHIYSQTSNQWSATRATLTGSQSDPFGGTNAWKVVEDDTAANTHYNGFVNSNLAVSTIPNNTTMCISVYIKKGAVSRDWVRLNLEDRAAASQALYFDLANEVTGTSVNGATGGFDPNPPTGWQRIYIVDSIGTGASTVSITLVIAEGNNDQTFSGTPLTYPDGITVFGGQVEASSYPTSYIPTSGTPVTRFSEEGAVDTTDIWTGTATIANGAMFSFAAGNSFAYMDNHLLTQYVKASGNKYRIRVNDDDDGYAVGFIAGADSALAVGAALNVSNCVNDTYDTFDGASATGFHAISDGSALANGGTADEMVTVTGGLYVASFSLSIATAAALTSGLAVAHGNSPDVYHNCSAGVNTQYTIEGAGSTCVYKFRTTLADDSEFTVSSLSVKPVNSASANGVRVVTATGGSTEGWTVTAGTDGFDYNNATYTVTIEFVETNGYTFPLASLPSGGWAEAGLQTAGTMVVDWWPLTAQSTYSGADQGIICVRDSGSSLLSQTPRLYSYDGDGANTDTFQADWTNAGIIKCANAWATGGNKTIYQNGVASTDAARAYDDAWTLGTNLVLFFDNHMPTLLSDLKIYDVAATEAKVQSAAASDAFTSLVADGVTGAVPSIKGLWIRDGHTTCTIDRVDAAGLQYDFYFDETLATNFTNSIAVGHDDAQGIYVASGKAVSGDYNAFPNHTSTPDAEYTSGAHDIWGEDPLFINMTTGNYVPNKGSPLCNAGSPTSTTPDINGLLIRIPEIGAYESRLCGISGYLPSYEGHGEGDFGVTGDPTTGPATDPGGAPF